MNHDTSFSNISDSEIFIDLCVQNRSLTYSGFSKEGKDKLMQKTLQLSSEAERAN